MEMMNAMNGLVSAPNVQAAATAAAGRDLAAQALYASANSPVLQGQAQQNPWQVRQGAAANLHESLANASNKADQQRTQSVPAGTGAVKGAKGKGKGKQGASSSGKGTGKGKSDRANSITSSTGATYAMSEQRTAIKNKINRNAKTTEGKVGFMHMAAGGAGVQVHMAGPGPGATSKNYYFASREAEVVQEHHRLQEEENVV